MAKIATTQPIKRRLGRIRHSFPLEVRAENPSQSIRISESSQPEVQAGVQSCDSMHHQYQMQTRWKRPGVERRREGPRQRGIQNSQKGLPRNAADPVEV